MRISNYFQVCIIFFIALNFMLVSCQSYKVVTDGYMVRGDENFISDQIPYKIYLGPLMPASLWEKSPLLPFRQGKLNSSQKRLLKQFGYKLDEDFTILLQNAKQAEYELITMQVKEKNLDVRNSSERKVDLSRFNLEKSDFAHWYHEEKVINGATYHHVLIPKSTRLNNDQFFILILKATPTFNLNNLKQMVVENAQQIQHIGFYPSDMVMQDCGEVDPEKYYQYYVPDEMINKNKKFIVKAFKKGNPDQLVFYTMLISPPHTWGAFKLCPGEYTVQFTSLEGEIIESKYVEMK